MGIRIFLADPHRIVRDGLRSLLEKVSGFEVVGEASNGDSMVSESRRLRPDVVVLEVAMPGIDGVETTREIRESLPDTRVVVLSSQSSRRTVIDVLRAGASAVLSKESGFEELLEALRSASAGHTYLGEMATGNLIDELQGNSVAPVKAPAERLRSSSRALTPREVEVLQLLASGKRVKEIARMLRISVKTVESHRQNMMDKLEIHSAIELTRYALREGLASV